jgi:hypothetical protein
MYLHIFRPVSLIGNKVNIRIAPSTMNRNEKSVRMGAVVLKIARHFF